MTLDIIDMLNERFKYGYNVIEIWPAKIENNKAIKVGEEHGNYEGKFNDKVYIKRALMFKIYMKFSGGWEAEQNPELILKLPILIMGKRFRGPIYELKEDEVKSICVINENGFIEKLDENNNILEDGAYFQKQADIQKELCDSQLKELKEKLEKENIDSKIKYFENQIKHYEDSNYGNKNQRIEEFKINIANIKDPVNVKINDKIIRGIKEEICFYEDRMKELNEMFNNLEK